MPRSKQTNAGVATTASTLSSRPSDSAQHHREDSERRKSSLISWANSYLVDALEEQEPAKEECQARGNVEGIFRLCCLAVVGHVRRIKGSGCRDG